VALVHQRPDAALRLLDQPGAITETEVYKKKYKPALKNDDSIVLFFYTLKDL
jgi:hypothetical protein